MHIGYKNWITIEKLPGVVAKKWSQKLTLNLQARKVGGPKKWCVGDEVKDKLYDV